MRGQGMPNSGETPKRGTWASSDWRTIAIGAASGLFAGGTSTILGAGAGLAAILEEKAGLFVALGWMKASGGTSGRS